MKELEVIQKFTPNDQSDISWEDIKRKDREIITFRAGSTTDAQNSGSYGVIFIAQVAYYVRRIEEVHETAGTDGGTVTLMLERLSGTEAKTAGDAILKAGFNLKGTANTIQKKEKADLQNSLIKPGDRLALYTSGTLTTLQGVNVTVSLVPAGRGDYL